VGLGQLTSGIAHDFNNVIQAISSGFMLIKKRTDDPKIVEISEHSAKAAERGRAVVNQLLSFARQQPIEMKKFDLCTMLREARPLLESTAGSRISLELLCPEDIGCIRTDAGLLEAALINLVANARDAMPNGGRIQIAAYPCEHAHDGGDFVTVAVNDTGDGMSPSVMARVTEPFFTTKPQGKGTGLGLAMVHGFAEQSGGKLRIESEEGRGTAIKLDLPRVKGTTIRYDVPVAMANDSRMTIDFQLSPLRDDEGTITHLIASGVGIDDRLAVEAELRALNQTLEERVRDEAARREATQIALMQSQKLEALGQPRPASWRHRVRRWQRSAPQFLRPLVRQLRQA
jgi:phosphoglycerate-specific signal transduction histidine kinase